MGEMPECHPITNKKFAFLQDFNFTYHCCVGVIGVHDVGASKIKY
jgi:hypothetical protein